MIDINMGKEDLDIYGDSCATSRISSIEKISQSLRAKCEWRRSSSSRRLASLLLFLFSSPLRPQGVRYGWISNRMHLGNDEERVKTKKSADMHKMWSILLSWCGRRSSTTPQSCWGQRLREQISHQQRRTRWSYPSQHAYSPTKGRNPIKLHINKSKRLSTDDIQVSGVNRLFPSCIVSIMGVAIQSGGWLPETRRRVSNTALLARGERMYDRGGTSGYAIFWGAEVNGTAPLPTVQHHYRRYRKRTRKTNHRSGVLHLVYCHPEAT